MAVSTKKEQEIAEIILKPDFPFERFCRISEKMIRRIARRQEKLRLKYGNNFLEIIKNEQQK